MIEKELHYILDFQNAYEYPYSEEINDGVLKQLPHMGTGLKILDVGCGRASLGEILTKRGFDVWGIESNPVAINQANAKIHKIIATNLENDLEIGKECSSVKFNYIIFSDVLEHIVDPHKILKNYLKFLAPKGKIIISLPNTLHWLNRINFLFGKFDYQYTGTLDRTHLRFFTFNSARKLILASGYQIECTDSTPFIIRSCLPILKKFIAYKARTKSNNAVCDIQHSMFYQFYQKFIYPIEYWIAKCWPSLLSFRMIYVAYEIRQQ
jgi:2-polyprenyl-3-methyl-5-hydroxy-6-metoxy-1,4-benzoquinol methylase